VVSQGAARREFLISRAEGGVRLAPANTPDKPDSAFKTWHDRLFGAWPIDVLGKDETPSEGAPQIELVNENGWKLPVDQMQTATEEAPARVVLDPAGTYTAEAKFIWRNWCTPAPKENLHLEIVLPDNPGQLSVPVQDPNGQYLNDTPHCDDRSSPSTLTVEAFK